MPARLIGLTSRLSHQTTRQTALFTRYPGSYARKCGQRQGTHPGFRRRYTCCTRWSRARRRCRGPGWVRRRGRGLALGAAAGTVIGIEHGGGAVQRVERRGGDGRQGGEQAQPARNRGMYIWRACRGMRGQVAPLLRAGPNGRYPRGGLAPRLYSDSVPGKLVYPRPGQKTVCRRWV